MSDIHVLAGDGRGKVSVVMHFAVPIGNNAVTVSWQDAIVNSGLGGATSMPIGNGDLQITQAEADLIAAGTLCEIRRSFQINSIADTADVRRDALRAFCTRKKAEAIADLQRQLQYAGYTESET